ncbi:ketopantoate reductase [Brevibacterium sanguinis]|uniref:2-dehydropantoate 2-reductase n=2 Tax=Brevibacterium TaxID=1696 RepID=A0A366IMR9_9MICO|nr:MULTISPECIES: 2-dehydropantoate 2-reductase [Brevibacterium]RBP66224.1 ketopantoate reductase [Brevibacterium sanguinis]RBP72875.1 ketopantoate reductase [Brevibacterium celere]
MRILIAGAGATGGAFGTRLVEAGRDVTFLVRPARAQRLRSNGLRFIAPETDRTNQVQVLTAAELADLDEDRRAFDLVIVAVKATALETVIADVRPAVGAQTLILPFLNGMAHIDRLEAEFPGQVLGGLVKIVATVRDDSVVQMTDMAVMTIGHLGGGEVSTEVRTALDVPGYRLQVLDSIVDALWEKWIFIATAGVVTCLFRAPVGPIIAAGGEPHVRTVIDELEAVATVAGHPVGAKAHDQTMSILTEPGSSFTSSLYRDVTAGVPSEIEHILGHLQVTAADLGVATPLLDLTLVQLRAGEIVRTS